MKYYTSLRPSTHTWDFAKRSVQAGINGFEVVFYDSYLSPKVHKEYLDLVYRIKTELDVGFTVHAPVLDIHLGSLNQKIREIAQAEIKASLDFARDIGASLVVVHPAPAILSMPAGEWCKQNYESLREATEKSIQQESNVLRSLKDLADYAPDILLGVENLIFPHELYRSPKEIQELLEKVNRSNVGFTFDVGHAQISGHNPTDFINVLGDQLYHVHLHDNNGVIDEHLPLGQGIIDYVGIIQSLKQNDYLGVVNLEFSPISPAHYERYLLQFR